MMGPVSPQKRGLVPAADQARIVDALQRTDAAQAELRAAVLAAIDHGGSVREIAQVSGLSTNTVSRWKLGQP